MEHDARSLYVFDEFTLDVGRARLLRAGAPIELRPKALDLLRYLIEHRGRVASKDELLRALWPNVVVTEDSLVKCVREVRTALGDDQHRYVKTASRRGYLFDVPVAVGTADARLAPAAATQAGASAVEPSSATATTEDSTPAETPSRIGSRAAAWLVTAVLLAFVAAAIAVYYSAGRDTRGARAAGASVAVLPFVSISAEAGQDYFSDGVSEELISVLADIPGLTVPSRTSSFTFKGTNADLRTIAAALGVDHVLEGSVRKSGAQVRITAQLIEVATDSHVWSAVYERELTDIFAVQDEIARSVARELEIELVGGDLPGRSSAHTPSVEAHDAYLLGLYHLRTQRSEEIFEARADFARAIELDPDYASAHAALAQAILSATIYGILDADTGYAEAEPQVARALTLDPRLAEAHAASGRLHLLRGDLEAAAADYRRAIELDPGLAPAQSGLSYALDGLGRRDEAHRALARALELDPLDGVLNWFAGNAALATGDAAGARAYYRRAVQFVPSQPNSYAGLGDVAIMAGRLDEGLEWYLRGVAQDPGQAHMAAIVGRLYYSLGDAERAQLWLDRAADLLDVPSVARLLREFEPLLVRRERADVLLTELLAVPKQQLEALGSWLLRKAALDVGDRDASEAFYRQNWPELFVAEPIVNATSFESAPDVAWLAIGRGERDRAARLLERALAVSRDPTERTMAPVDWRVVLIETEVLALQGRKAEALAALRRAVDSGWRFEWWQVEHDPTLAAISGEPEFQAMLGEVKADLASQLERVRTLEGNGSIDGLPPQR